MVKRALAWLAVLTLLFAGTVLATNENTEAEPTPRPAPTWRAWMEFDRSPDAYRVRFNEQLLERDADARIERALLLDETQCAFENRNNGNAFLLDGALFRMRGTLNEQGGVERLEMHISPFGAAEATYAPDCGMLMSLAVLSFFPNTDEADERALSLLLRYDLRFSTSARSLKNSAASAVTVIQSRRLRLSLNQSWPSDEILFTVRDLGEANEAAVRAETRKRRCNELLLQTSLECGDLAACGDALENCLASDAPDIEEASAICDQVEEIVSVLRELRLDKYEKTRALHGHLKRNCDRLSETLRALRVCIEAGDSDGARVAYDALNSAIVSTCTLRKIGADGA